MIISNLDRLVSDERNPYPSAMASRYGIFQMLAKSSVPCFILANPICQSVVQLHESWRAQDFWSVL